MTDYSELVKALRCENTGDDECGSSDCPYWSGLGCMDGQLMDDAAAAIEALQAQLPKRGEWVDAFVGELPVQVCSKCNTFFPLAYTGGGHHYCPNCGAKMEVQE